MLSDCDELSNESRICPVEQASGAGETSAIASSSSGTACASKNDNDDDDDGDASDDTVILPTSVFSFSF